MRLVDKILQDTFKDEPWLLFINGLLTKKAMREIAWMAWKEVAIRYGRDYVESAERMIFDEWYDKQR